jgi:phosphatidylcholine synthase
VFLLHTSKWLTAIACILLACTQLTNWKFVHPMQVTRFRKLTVPITVLWLVLVLLMTWQLPHHSDIGRVVLLACPLYIVGLGVWRTLTTRSAQPMVKADDVHHAGA